jgi:3-oxoacyl-[acyl-carrier protein] reductase
VLITGASSDIGLVLAHEYLTAGWHVIAHYRTMRDELNGLGSYGNCTFWQVDFSDADLFERALRNDFERIASADGFVHLAADLAPRSLVDASVADMVHAIQVNSLSAFRIMALLGPEMAKRGFGRIVLGSSIGVKYGGGSESFPYSLSKHALEFIPSAARKWARSNVLMNTVRIGLTDTRIHNHHPTKRLEDRAALSPIGRAAKVQEMARSLFWFGSEQNTYVHGEVIAVAGGE